MIIYTYVHVLQIYTFITVTITTNVHKKKMRQRNNDAYLQKLAKKLHYNLQTLKKQKETKKKQ